MGLFSLFMGALWVQVSPIRGASPTYTGIFMPENFYGYVYSERMTVYMTTDDLDTASVGVTDHRQDLFILCIVSSAIMLTVSSQGLTAHRIMRDLSRTGIHLPTAILSPIPQQFYYLCMVITQHITGRIRIDSKGLYRKYPYNLSPKT